MMILKLLIFFFAQCLRYILIFVNIPLYMGCISKYTHARARTRLSSNIYCIILKCIFIYNNKYINVNLMY